MKRVSDILNCVLAIAPLSRQESYDNSGLIIGDPNNMVDKVLVALDVTEDVVDEAISKSCHFIISHHPFIFNGLKRINPSSSVGRIVIKAIKTILPLRLCIPILITAVLVSVIASLRSWD